jgi:hypothetical protein
MADSESDIVQLQLSAAADIRVSTIMVTATESWIVPQFRVTVLLVDMQRAGHADCDDVMLLHRYHRHPAKLRQPNPFFGGSIRQVNAKSSWQDIQRFQNVSVQARMERQCSPNQSANGQDSPKVSVLLFHKFRDHRKAFRL